jgi:hypothetical protein
MRYRESLTVPAGTTKLQPAIQTMKLSYGVITLIEVLFPAGSAGLVSLAIDRYESQLYPASPDAAFIGDDQIIPINDNYPLTEQPYTVRLRGWSPDAELDHTVYVDITVERAVAVAVPAALPAALPEGF